MLRGTSILMLLLGFLASAANAQSILYVDDDAAPGGDGQSWSSAFNDLQDALQQASSHDEIRIAEGIYKPDRGSGDRNATFEVVDVLTLLGGFAGVGSQNPNERDINRYETFISGDLFGNDGPDRSDNSDNSWYILDVLESGDLQVDGLIFIGAGHTAVRPVGPLSAKRCGFYSNLFGISSIRNVLKECRFERNFIGVQANGSLLQDCDFIGNDLAINGGGVTVERCLFLGSTEVAINLIGGSDSHIHSSLFTGNAEGILARHTTVFVQDCFFAGTLGSAVRLGSLEGRYEASFINVLFTGNGAAMTTEISTSYPSFLLMVNCTLWRNVIAFEGSMNDTTMTNSIVWGNELNSVTKFSAGSINYSTIEGWTGEVEGVWNNGHFPEHNPRFVDADGPDNIPGTEDDNLRLGAGSPSIDSGDNQAVPIDVVVDVSGNPRFVDDPDTPDVPTGNAPIVDRGAYEFQGRCTTDTECGNGLFDVSIGSCVNGICVVSSDREQDEPPNEFDEDRQSSEQGESLDELESEPVEVPNCTMDTDCDDGLFCNGSEQCKDGACVVGHKPCDTGLACNEDVDVCELESVIQQPVPVSQTCGAMGLLTIAFTWLGLTRLDRKPLKKMLHRPTPHP